MKNILGEYISKNKNILKKAKQFLIMDGITFKNKSCKKRAKTKK